MRENKKESELYEQELQNKKNNMDDMIKKVCPRTFQDDPIIPKWVD
jgi:hypothetical protein